MVATKNGQVPIDYRVIKEGTDWKVYDVVIEGVSLITDYRTQFREILGNNPPEKLLKPYARSKARNENAWTRQGARSSARGKITMKHLAIVRLFSVLTACAAGPDFFSIPDGERIQVMRRIRGLLPVLFEPQAPY